MAKTSWKRLGSIVNSLNIKTGGIKKMSEEMKKEATTNEKGQDLDKVVFAKPYKFEGQTYTEIDLSGLENLKSSDLMYANRIVEKMGMVSVNPENTMEVAFVLASSATKLPVEFFEELPICEGIKLKNRVRLFLYNMV